MRVGYRIISDLKSIDPISTIIRKSDETMNKRTDGRSE